MSTLSWLVGGALAAAASAAGAQPTAQSHEQHQATAQHEATAQHPVAGVAQKYCCDEMMRRMMMDMMQRHQGIGDPKGPSQPEKDHAH